jgi:proteasome lid subunit RPN8/RPN11
MVRVAKGSTVTATVLVSLGHIHETVEELRRAGALNQERVVLWLGRRQRDEIAIVEAYMPIQITAEDYFRIPPEGMAKLFNRLRETKTMIAAQVHSHPKAAFHSEADDAWAIVRHVGALSFVVPDFGATTTADNFSTTAALFALSAANSWQLVPPERVRQRYRIER